MLQITTVYSNSAQKCLNISSCLILKLLRCIHYKNMYNFTYTYKQRKRIMLVCKNIYIKRNRQQVYPFFWLDQYEIISNDLQLYLILWKNILFPVSSRILGHCILSSEPLILSSMWTCIFLSGTNIFDDRKLFPLKGTNSLCVENL
jgi:hypothetical protein